MDAVQRRERIQQILRDSKEPVSAAAMASQVHVSRQIIVGDVALLRAGGMDIQATPRGYILQTQDSEAEGNQYTIACRHGRDNLKEELYAVVDNGGGLLDVIVEHPVYGQITGKLHIFSRFDADNFVEKLLKNRASILCDITDNVHLHTLICRSEADYQRILAVLEEKGILFKK